jgi:hypothetical protein
MDILTRSIQRDIVYSRELEKKRQKVKVQKVNKKKVFKKRKENNINKKYRN